MKKRWIVRGWAIFTAGLFVVNTPEIASKWNEKIVKQQNAIVRAESANQLYESLENTIIPLWIKILSSEKGVESLVTLNDVLDVQSSGLLVPTQLLLQPKISDVQYLGELPGVSKVCVKNTSQGFMLGANSIQQLLKGFYSLDSRVDTDVSSFTYINFKGTQQIILDELCVLLRTEGGDNA